MSKRGDTMTKHNTASITEMTPKEFRSMVRSGEWTSQTIDVCRGYATTDLVIVPKEYAYDYFLFSQRNPRVCPILDVTDPGSPHPQLLAPDADLRTDLPSYQVYKDGQLIEEPTDIKKYWRDDLVAFLTGCSRSFVWALRNANINAFHVGVFITNIPCTPVGPFRANMAVSCRYFKNAHDAIRAIQITSRYSHSHGAPIHIGDPAALGIKDLSHPLQDRIPSDQIPLARREAPRLPMKGEIPMFWACGATNRELAVNAKLPLMIVDNLRSNFITDKFAEELVAL